MGECLRKVAQRGTGRGIDLLGEKPHVIGIAAELLEQVPRFVHAPAAEGEVLDGPEAGNAKYALARSRWDAFLLLWRVPFVAVQKPVAGTEQLANPAIGASHP